jgi:hypothetical protein
MDHPTSTSWCEAIDEIPHTYCPIVTAGDGNGAAQPPANGHTRNPVTMTGKGRSYLCAMNQVPYSNCAIPAAGHGNWASLQLAYRNGQDSSVTVLMPKRALESQPQISIWLQRSSG